MEPLTDITTAWSFAKKVYDLGKGIKNHEEKHQLDELREKLRFKSDDYEFRTPFHYAKAHPEQALCPKCFAGNIAAPMGEPGRGCSNSYRACLVCGHQVQIRDSAPSPKLRTDYPLRRRRPGGFYGR